MRWRRKTFTDWLSADVGPTFEAGHDWLAVVSAACVIQDVEAAVCPMPVLIVEEPEHWELPVIIPGLALR